MRRAQMKTAHCWSAQKISADTVPKQDDTSLFKITAWIFPRRPIMLETERAFRVADSATFTRVHWRGSANSALRVPRHLCTNLFSARWVHDFNDAGGGTWRETGTRTAPATPNDAPVRKWRENEARKLPWKLLRSSSAVKVKVDVVSVPIA